MISIIIPTHNRANFLKKLLANISKLEAETDFEIIIVDNNSKDNTKEIVESFRAKNIKYVFEKSTSFTKARDTGAKNASGDILLYFDDDVIVQDGTLKEVTRIFKKYPSCAIASGKILPYYQQEPPNWIIELQKSFNGFSLYDLGENLKEVHAVPGPMMAIRASVFWKIGGFPPDTIGVESNNEKKTFKKLYIGPGDYGFCLKCRLADYKIIYSPKMCVQHIIPSFRLTKEFWVSRMIGEGHCKALSIKNMIEYESEKKSKFFYLKNLIRHFIKAKLKKLKNNENILSPDEIWFEYYKALIGMQKVLDKNPKLCKYLWELGYNGVCDENFDIVLSKLPKMYKDLAL
ncbi:MAG: glycosyltransferase family 2 protein [Candidatus Babeliales bacterium]